MEGSQPSFSAYQARALARSPVARLGWIGASVMTDGLVAVAWLIAASSVGGSIARTPGQGVAALAARIRVEAAAGLLAEMAGLDELDQDFRRRVVLLADALLEHAHHVEADVEPDEVGELERAHRVVQPDLRAG